jgi:hypothetical protein
VDRPSFVSTATDREYCVLVTWADEANARISHFATSQDAQRWIDRESERWLANRARTLDERRTATNSASNFEGSRVQLLQAARNWGGTFE